MGKLARIWQIRGTQFGIRTDQSAGTSDRRKAQKVLNHLRDNTESGAFVPTGALTFADAVLSYIQADGETKFLSPLVEHFSTRPLPEMTQSAIDNAAATLYPKASPATRNRQVYTPISAILKHAGMDFVLKRPKGAQGSQRTEWMTPEQANALFDAAGRADDEFRLFLITLCYTGMRLSEALGIETRHVDLEARSIYLPMTKNTDPRLVHLPPLLAAELADHPRGLARAGQTLFRFRKNGHLYGFMRDARRAAGLPTVSFHTCRHTWATWMRRYANLDTKGLVDTGAWRDQKSAARYAHVVVTEEAKKADNLPGLAPLLRNSED